MKEIEKVRYYFIEEIKQNELIFKRHKKVCKILNYTGHLLILASKVTGCVSISALASLVGIPVGIASSEITAKSSVITAGIRKYKSVIKKKNKKHDKIVLKELLKENDDMKDGIKSSNNKQAIYKTMLS